RVFADDLHDVFHVRDDRIEAVSADIARAEDDADDAALVGDRAELGVVDVAPVLERAKNASVADDGWFLGDAAGVEEALLAAVGEVDEDVLLLAFFDELEAPAREAGAVGATLSVCRIASLVRAEVEEPDVSDAAACERGHVLEVAFERVRALDPEQRAD